jgi:hypothetical protein
VFLILQIYCETCARHIKGILADERIKGQGAQSAQQYATSSNFITKHNIQRHLKSVSHGIGLEFERSAPSPSSDSEPSTASSGSQLCQQPRIDVIYKQATTDARMRLLRTVYVLALEGLPLSKFESMVNIQKANGLSLIAGYSSTYIARELISCLACAIRLKIKNLLEDSLCFSLFTDGSQAKKTNAEKELLMIRVVRNGVPTFFCIALLHMDDFGNASALNIKTAIDHTFKAVLGLHEELYTKCLISATSDGASVNTGVYKGLLVRLRDDQRPWLIQIHCASHRLELGLKDSLMKFSAFKEVHSLMILMYYTFKKSGKLKAELKAMGNALCVDITTLPKVHGTRFVAHQARGLKSLIHNWAPMVQCFENCIATQGFRPLKNKLEGILKRLQSPTFLLQCLFYLTVLNSVSSLSLKLQEQTLCMHELPWHLDQTVIALDEIKDEDVSYFFTLHEILHTQDSQMEFTLLQAGHNRLDASKQKKKTIAVPMRQSRREKPLEHTLTQLKTEIDEVRDCLKKRLNFHASNPVLQQMKWIDPSSWMPGDENFEKEVENIFAIAKYFQATLEHRSLNPDIKTIKQEWRRLRSLVNHQYTGWEAKRMWEQIFTFRKKDFPNICSLATLVFSVGLSNATVEKCFSQLTSMLSDRRTNLGPLTMENLLLIKANHLSWIASERDDLMDVALAEFEKKRRKVATETIPFNTIGTTAQAPRCEEDSESESEAIEPEEECLSDDCEEDAVVMQEAEEIFAECDLLYLP